MLDIGGPIHQHVKRFSKQIEKGDRRMRSNRFLFTAVITVVSLMLAAVATVSDNGTEAVDTAQDRGSRTWRMDLHPTTGFNDLCGAPVFEGAPNMTFSAAYNPNGPDPIELTPEFCEENPEAWMGTWANPEFYAANGWPLPDQRLLNIPYHQIPIPGVEWDGTRAQLQDEGPGSIGPFPPTRSTPNEPETIASFTAVSGRMSLRCHTDGTATVRIRARGYKPNSVLTVWMVWGFPPDSGFPPVVPRPLGGVPNTTDADKHGRMSFERELGFCPMEPQPGPDGVTMIPLAVDLASHPDGVGYGGYPEHPLAEFTFIDPDTGERFTSRGVGAGIVGMDQGAFPLLINQPPPSP